MNTYRRLIALVLACVSLGSCYAEASDIKANNFSGLYASLCMKNINDVGALRNALIGKNLPKFSPQQAALFLNGNDGDAWPIPVEGMTGNFVLAVFSEKNFCTIYARRATQTDVEQQFVKLVATAPAPLVAEAKPDIISDTSAYGKTHTISYTWSLPQSRRKLLFTLTTSNSDAAQIQALASAATINE